MSFLRRLDDRLKNIQLLIYPHRCLLCGRPGDAADLCPACYADLPWLRHACLHCGAPLPETALSCGECMQEPPPWDASIIPLRYQAPLDGLILSLKFERRLAVAPLLGSLMARAVLVRGEPLPDALLPVPMHPRRLRERGFNQAQELARELAAQLHLPILNGVVKRARNTVMQSRLDGKARRSNLRDAFALTGVELPGRVAIIDDVVTTGTTVAELAKALRQGGVQRIEVWACAKAG